MAFTSPWQTLVHVYVLLCVYMFYCNNYQDVIIFKMKCLKSVSKTSSQLIFVLQYPNNTVLVRYRFDGLRRLLDHIPDAYSDAGLVVNSKKTEIIQT